MMIRLAITLVALLAAAPVRAGDDPLRVRAELSANTLNVTQRTVLTVVCDVADGWTLVDQPFESMGVDETLGPLRVVSAPRMAPARYANGLTTWSWKAELAPGLPETGEIPALRFKAEQIGGDRFTIARTDPIPVTVESLLESEPTDWDPTALREPLEPLPARSESHTALYVSVGALVLLGAGALTLTQLERRRRDPNRVRARRLDAIRDGLQAIDTHAPVAEVAQAAHAAVRAAMSEVAGPRALAATGADLVPLLRDGVGLNPTDAALVADFFSRVDPALFAGGTIDPDQAGPLRDDALRAIGSIRLAAGEGMTG